MDPTNLGLFAFQAGWVFTLRSMGLWSAPGEAGASLTRMALEKQRAFTEGWIAAGQATMRGEMPDRVMEAALAPSRRRVSANLRRLRAV